MLYSKTVTKSRQADRVYSPGRPGPHGGQSVQSWKTWATWWTE